ncbi:MAG: cysteine desulfurase family protein [Pseudomonadota bacterium]
MGTEYIYLDNAATTAVAPEVIEEMNHLHAFEYANPSSTHAMGVAAARIIEAAGRTIEQCVGGGQWDVIFTSTGTEANNLAVTGYLLQEKSGRVVTTAIEHSSVLEPCKLAAGRGIDVIRVMPDAGGVVSVEDVLAQVDGATVLVSVQHANNETGTVQPVEDIGRSLKKRFPGLLLHVDAIQTAGKIDISSAAKWADLMTLSAHKMHGPKGIGALLVKRGTKKPSPLVRGGGQQWGVRSGTDNVPGAAGMARALKMAESGISGNGEMMRELEDAFEDGFGKTDKARRLFENSPRVPGFILIGFDKIPSDVIENSMEGEGYIVSSTAACSSKSVKRSHVLAAAGVPEDVNVIRVVPSRYTSADDMRRASAALSGILARLQSRL